MDVDLDGIGAGFFIQAEHLGGQLLFAHHPPRTRDQGFEHRLLARGQGQQIIIEGEAPSIEVIDQRPAALLALATEYATTQQGLDPRFKLSELERLGQVVIGAQVQAMNPILDVTACCQHQHRYGFAACAQAREHLEAVHARQPHIEHRHCIFLAGQRQVSSHAIMQHVHCQPRALESLGHALS
ncbi:hypothetical protein D3C77_553250 [compost metagenome]